MSLLEAIQFELSKGYARIQPIDYDGARYWLKQREQHGLRMWLQKGNAARAFDAERAALKSLEGADLPVARLVADGENWMAFADVGISLKDLHRSGSLEPSELESVYAAAGKALADLHNAQVVHGRPAIKDILWDGSQITFIDFERYSEKRNSPNRIVLDLMMFVHSIFALGEGYRGILDAAVAGYRSNSGESAWQGAGQKSARLLWFKPILWPIKLRRQGRAKDIRAIIPALKYMKINSSPGSAGF